MSIVYIKNKLYTYDLYNHISYEPRLYLNDAIVKLDDDINNIELLNIIAYSYFYLNDFYNSLDYALRAYKAAENKSSSDELYYTCNLLGHIYRYLGIYESSAQYYMTSLQLSLSYHAQEKRCTTLRHLATTYIDINMFSSALDYAIESLQLAQLINSYKLIADIDVTLCRIYIQNKAYEKAFKLSETVIGLYQSLNDQKGLIRIYLLTGDLQGLTNNFTLSNIYYEKSLSLSKQIRHNYGLINANYALGCLFIKKSRYSKAKYLLEKSLMLANRYNIQRPKIAIYYALSDLHEQENHYKQAFNLYKTATELNNNINSFKYRESIYKLQDDYKKNREETQLRLYSEQNQTLEMLNKQLKKEVQLDPLTNLLNRRGLRFTLEKYSFDGTHGLILCDIDDFKNVNDTYGHQCGDYILIQLSKVLKNICPPSFKISRWGGEEFLIILPNSSLDESVKQAENIRNHVESISNSYRQHNIHITLTFGVTSLLDNFEHSVDIVDQCLYIGKNSGRNKVISHTNLSPIHELDSKSTSQYAT